MGHRSSGENEESTTETGRIEYGNRSDDQQERSSHDPSLTGTRVCGRVLAVTEGPVKTNRDGKTMDYMAPPANGTIIRTHSRTAKLSAPTHLRLHRCLGVLTELWNSALAMRKQFYKFDGVTIGYRQQQDVLTASRRHHPEMAQYDLRAQRSILRRLDRAYRRFFQLGGCPRFKGRRGVRSFEIDEPAEPKPAGRGYAIAVKGVGRFKFGGKLPAGKLKTIRVVKTAKRVMLQFVIEHSMDHVRDEREPVGIDVGIKNRIALSDGTTEPTRKLGRDKIKRWQRQVSRAERGSNNRRKRLLSLRKEWQRVAERERGCLHELTARLVQDVSVRWAVEDLEIGNMVRNHSLARSIMEQQWGRFVQQLTYKAESAGGWVERVDPRGTSQRCSKCGSVPEKAIDLNVRVYRCCSCGLRMDRDVNAAKNVLQRGLAALTGGDGGDKPPPVTSGAGRGAASPATA